MSADARTRILARIRTGLDTGHGTNADNSARRRAVIDRITAHGRGTIPARSAGGAAARVALLQKMVAASAATIDTVATAKDVPEAVARYLRERNLAAAIRTGADPLVAALPWHLAPALSRAEGPAEPDDTAGLSVVAAAIAETGTLVLTAGPDNPTSLNFLPETHIALVPASRVHAAYEDAFDILRTRYGEGKMPRVVNFITGPSRTADIEQTLLMGAHGPKRVHVILIEDS